MDWLTASIILFGALATLNGCQRKSQGDLSASHTHYTVGNAWQAGTNWFYPRETFELQTTGIATIAAYQAGQVLADGTVFRDDDVTGGHQTLQLPAVVRVTNLANGRQITLRLDDRGPADPGRALALSPRAAALLGATGPTPVSIDEDAAYSQAIAQRYGGGPGLQIATAPVGTVTAESLPPLGGAPSAPAAHPQSDAASTVTDDQTYPAIPPVALTQTTPRAVDYLIDGGTFSDQSYAAMFAARIGGTFTSSGGRRPSYQITAGPFRTIRDADAALDLARRNGLTGAKLIVE